MHDLRPRHFVRDHSGFGVEDDVVSGDQLVEVTEVSLVTCAVSGDNNIADLARHRSSGPVPGAAIERGQSDPFEKGSVDTDFGNRHAAELP